MNEAVTNTNTLGANLLANTRRVDVKNVQDMVNEYNTLHKDIKKRIKTLNKFYRKQISSKAVSIGKAL